METRYLTYNCDNLKNPIMNTEKKEPINETKQKQNTWIENKISSTSR